MSVTINKLEIENIKRVKAVQLEPSTKGLTVIGGDNNQGKTSVLDAITWALGGDRYRPSEPQREGSVVPPSLHIELSNGIVVERKGKNSALKVIDSTGNKAGQQLLNEFVSQLALDLPKFMQANNKEKADTLLKIIGVGDQLYKLEEQEKTLYNQRTAIGQIADQKKKYADELPFFPDAPKELVSASDLIMKQQEILARNGENQKKREAKDKYNKLLAEAQLAFDAAKRRLEEATIDAATARKSAEDLHDESTAEIEESIASIEEINRKVRTNMEREKAEIDAQEYKSQYEDLTDKIQSVRKEKTELLTGADLPLSGLTVEDGELLYRGFKWDNISGSEQLKVAVAIIRKLNPDCGFVLVDKLEQMDLKTLNEFGNWLNEEGLQAIATRVSSGSECSIIIEDGYSVIPENNTPKVAWEEGHF